jgi:hypothetical protein
MTENDNPLPSGLVYSTLLKSVLISDTKLYNNFFFKVRYKFYKNAWHYIFTPNMSS